MTKAESLKARRMGRSKCKQTMGCLGFYFHAVLIVALTFCPSPVLSSQFGLPAPTGKRWHKDKFIFK
jgi:hypothetical protein